MKTTSNKSFSQIVTLVFKGVAMAMAVAVVVLNILGVAELQTQVLLLGIGLACLAIVTLNVGKETDK
jgi:hypothetical protein